MQGRTLSRLVSLISIFSAFFFVDTSYFWCLLPLWAFVLFEIISKKVYEKELSENRQIVLSKYEDAELCFIVKRGGALLP